MNCVGSIADGGPLIASRFIVQMHDSKAPFASFF
jgi:hypothetical protein